MVETGVRKPPIYLHMAFRISSVAGAPYGDIGFRWPLTKRG
jgi:hypothetical protein